MTPDAVMRAHSRSCARRRSSYSLSSLTSGSSSLTGDGIPGSTTALGGLMTFGFAGKTGLPTLAGEVRLVTSSGDPSLATSAGDAWVTTSDGKATFGGGPTSAGEVTSTVDRTSDGEASAATADGDPTFGPESTADTSAGAGGKSAGTAGERASVGDSEDTG